MARPIDFLGGVDFAGTARNLRTPFARGRALQPEQIARRDNFWNGVVLTIAKNDGPKPTRNFKRRPRDNGCEDAPLQLYLRRLEPLVLQLTEHAAGRVSAARALRRTEYPAAIRDLIAQLRQMPGVGPRSAERIALWIVQARGEQPETDRARDHRRRGRPCGRARAADFLPRRRSVKSVPTPRAPPDLLCVVEQPTDILPLEKTSAFRGRYHSLGGRISPLDHVGPEDLRIKELLERVEQENFSEIIFALAADVEGEATTNYLVELLKPLARHSHPHRAWIARRRRAGIGG